MSPAIRLMKPAGRGPSGTLTVEVFVMSEQTKVSPRDHVFAVVGSREAARAAIDSLVRQGYPESIVFEGDDVTKDVDPKGEKAGNPVEKVMKMIGDHLSEQPNYLSQYQEEA